MFSTGYHFQILKAGRVNLIVVLNTDYEKSDFQNSSLELRLYKLNFEAEPPQNQTLTPLFTLRSF